MPDRARVLLVDDDRLVRMNLSLTLCREGYELDVATCAAEAFAFLGEHHYELVLTDIGLPDESGFEVLRAAKRADPETKVILVTGSQSWITPEKAVVEGAETLILKPFALAELLDAVRRVFPARPISPDPRPPRAPEPPVV